MDVQKQRLGEAIGQIWAAHCPETPLKMVVFGDPGHNAYANMQWRRELGGVKMVIGPEGDPLWLGLHELGHAVLGVDGEGIEERCDWWANNYASLWREPVKAYIEKGDHEPMREILAAMRWGRKRAAQRPPERRPVRQDDDLSALLRRLEQRLEAVKAQQSRSNERRFVEICRKHGVTRLEQRPGTCAPWIEFRPDALKSIDLEVEAEIKRLFPYGIKDAKMLAFVRRILLRRKKYVGWVRDLMSAGLIPAPVTA